MEKSLHGVEIWDVLGSGACLTRVWEFAKAGTTLETLTWKVVWRLVLPEDC